MTDEHRSVTRAVEVAVFAPLGAAAYVRDVAPSFLQMFVARGRAEIDRRADEVERSVRHARSLGEVTLAFGVPHLRRTIAKRVDEVRSRAEPRTSPPAEPAAPPEPARAPVGPSTPPAPAASGADLERSGALAIPGYDALSASQVVERLVGLDPEELEAVRAYEDAHRGRRTILGKIEQLIAT